MPVAPPGKVVIGIDLRNLRVGGAHASWGSALTETVQRFLHEDEDFLAWEQRRSFRVTETTLREFPLEEIRRRIGAQDLENITNSDGFPVLPLLDEKIRRKMAAVYKTLPNTQRQQALQPHSSTQPNPSMRYQAPTLQVPTHQYHFSNNNFFTTTTSKLPSKPSRPPRPEVDSSSESDQYYLSHDEDEAKESVEEELSRLWRENIKAQRKRAKLMEEFLKIEEREKA